MMKRICLVLAAVILLCAGCASAEQVQLPESRYALQLPDGMEYDTWLGCVAFRLGKVKFVKTPWLLYRRHGHNASCLADTNKNSLFVKFRRRYNILKSCLLYLRS